MSLRPVLLSALVVALVSVLVAWGRPGFYSAEATDSGPQMSFGVVGDDVTCDAADQPTKCTAPFDSGDPKAGEFILTVNAIGIPIDGYGSFTLHIFGICSPELEEYANIEAEGFVPLPGIPLDDCDEVDADADTTPDLLLAWNPRNIDSTNDPDTHGPIDPATNQPVPDGIPDPDPNDADSCTAEVVWPDLGGGACFASVRATGQRVLGGGTSLPLPLFDKSNHVGRLTELEVHCAASGTVELLLLAATADSSLGSSFSGVEVDPATFAPEAFFIKADETRNLNLDNLPSLLSEPSPGEALDRDNVTEELRDYGIADVLEFNCVPAPTADLHPYRHVNPDGDAHHHPHPHDYVD